LLIRIQTGRTVWGGNTEIDSQFLRCLQAHQVARGLMNCNVAAVVSYGWWWAKVVTFPGVVVGKGIIVVASVRLLLDLGSYVAVGVVALVAVAEDLIVRLKEEEEGLGDLTTARNGDAEPFTTLLKEGKERNWKFCTRRGSCSTWLGCNNIYSCERKSRLSSFWGFCWHRPWWRCRMISCNTNSQKRGGRRRRRRRAGRSSS